MLALLALAWAEETLRVGDQRGNACAPMEAAGVLAGLPYRLERREFPNAAPLLEARDTGAIDAGGVGDAPFTVVAFPIRQGCLTILGAKTSPIRSVADPKGKRIAANRGSIGYRLSPSHRHMRSFGSVVDPLLLDMDGTIEVSITERSSVGARPVRDLGGRWKQNINSQRAYRQTSQKCHLTPEMIMNSLLLCLSKTVH